MAQDPKRMATPGERRLWEEMPRLDSPYDYKRREVWRELVKQGLIVDGYPADGSDLEELLIKHGAPDMKKIWNEANARGVDPLDRLNGTWGRAKTRVMDRSLLLKSLPMRSSLEKQ